MFCSYSHLYYYMQLSTIVRIVYHYVDLFHFMFRATDKLHDFHTFWPFVDI